MRKSELQESPYILNDALVVECNLSVIKLMPPHEESDVKLYSITPKVPPSELVDNLSRLLEATEGADVSFKVKDEVFPAHKIILAMRSPVFWVDFYGPMRDESRRIITVEDMQPAVFRGLLHFIYTDSLPPLDDLYDDDDDDDEYDEMLRHLLVAADRYSLYRRKQMCEEELCKRMDAETVTNTLALADKHQCERLKKACVAFMASVKVMTAVVETHGFKKHLKTCSRPLSLEGIPNEKRQPSIRRKYLLRSRPLSVEGIPQGGKEKRQPSIQRKYLLRSRPLSLKRKYFLRSLKQDI
jgi:speckle-type POZ protein